MMAHQILLFSIVRKPALQLYLKPGHKIGRPVTLFEKIEQSRLDELKKRFGGSQSEPKSISEEEPDIQSIEDAQKAVDIQGSKVRAMKALKVEKNEIQEQVKILLNLKKVVENLQKKSL